MQAIPTRLSGVTIFVPARHEDARGFFSESWNKVRLSSHGVDAEFVQDNHSLSKTEGTVRGLHYQVPPHAQAKLVRCGRGSLLDVAVDFRSGSPTYGHWISEILSFANGRQLFIPEGFLHGFVTLEPDTEIIYKCTDYYSPECDRAIRFDDPDIGVEWGMDLANAVLSSKDEKAAAFRDVVSPFRYGA